MKTFPLLILLISVSACSSHLIPLRDDFDTNKFGIFIHFDEGVNEEIQEAIYREVDDLILKYDYLNKSIKVEYSSVDCANCFSFYIQNTSLVEPGQQGAAVLINIIGLVALPIALGASESNLILAFWYFPKVNSYFEMNLPEGVYDLPDYNPLLRTTSSPGFLVSRDNQIIKHSKAFVSFLEMELGRIEKQYFKNTSVPNE